MAEYIFTNLPQYVKINSRSEFSSSVVSSGAVLLFTEDGYTLTGKLPDGTFITIGGSSGTDVSDTTATAGTVLGGYDFYDSAGSKTTGTIPTVSAGISGNLVIVPSGYIAASQTFNVSGGIDVSDTTATPAAVLGGYDFYDSAGVKTSGAIPTLASSSYTPGTSNQVISSGQYLGGNQTILGDANLAGSNILSGVSIFGVSGTLRTSGGAEVTLGYISSGLFQPLTFSGTSAYDGGSAVNLSCYTYNLPVSSGGSWVSSGAIVSESIIVSKGLWVDTTVNSGGDMKIRNSGIASGITVNQHGMVYVIYGGSATDITISGGNLLVGGVSPGSASPGAYASGVTVSSGGRLDSEPGGNVIVQDVTVNAGGTVFIHPYTSASDITVLSGGTAYIDLNAYYSNIVSSAGAIVSYVSDPVG